MLRMWVASFSDLPLSVRSILKMERVVAWRRRGKLVEGIHYLPIERAVLLNITVHSKNVRGNSKQNYIYNVNTLLPFFSDKDYKTRKPR